MKLNETAVKLEDDVYGHQRAIISWMASVSRCIVEDALEALPAAAAERRETTAAATIGNSCDETFSSKKYNILKQTQSNGYCGGVSVEDVMKLSILEAFHLGKRIWRVAEVRKVYTQNVLPPEPHIEVKFLKMEESANAILYDEHVEHVPLTWTRPVGSSDTLHKLMNLLDGELSMVIHSVQHLPQPILQDLERNEGWETVGRGGGVKGPHYRGCRGGNSKQVGRKRSNRSSRNWFRNQEMVFERNPHPSIVSKYWAQRYRYWSRFDEGITMSCDDWYSVTPEAIAVHIAQRAKCGILIDAFCGCGGNAVRFAAQSRLVICIDKNPVALQAARANATLYGVANRMEFIVGDAMELLPTMSADVVFLSPPWGGPAYTNLRTYNLHTMLPAPLDGVKVFLAGRKASRDVIYFLPRNCDSTQLARLADGPGEVCEVEAHWLNNKLKTKAAYYGRLAISSSSGLDPGKEAFKQGGKVGQVMDAQVMADAEDDLYMQWQKQI